MTFEDTSPKDDGSDSQEEGSLAKRKERLEQNRISARECEFYCLLIGADVKGRNQLLFMATDYVEAWGGTILLLLLLNKFLAVFSSLFMPSCILPHSLYSARKRKKNMIEELQRTVITLSRENKQLNERNEELRKELVELGTANPGVVSILL